MVNETEPPPEDSAGEEEEDGRGRPPHDPTEENRAKVKSLSGSGVPEKSIAALIGLGSKNTLRKYYHHELMVGNATFQAMLGQTAARLALGGSAEYYPPGHRDAGKLSKAEVLPNVSVLIFLCKTRLGLQERVRLDLEEDRRPDDGNEFNTVGLTKSEQLARVLAILDAARARGTKRAADSRRPVGAIRGQAARGGLQQRSDGVGIRGSGGGRKD